MPEPFGLHVLYDLYDCDPALLDRLDRLRALLHEAVRSVDMVALEACAHQYQPQGVSVVLLVAESHMAIHTWPESGYAAVDFFSCRTDVDPLTVRAVFERALTPGRIEMQRIDRGRRPSG